MKLSASVDALFTELPRRRILGSLRLTSGGGIMIIRRKGMRPPLAKARKEGGHARRSAIINVKPAPRTSKEESDRKEEWKSGDFDAQTIIGHGGPDDAGSSSGVRPPGDRCSKAARYARGALDDGGTRPGRPRRPR